MAREDPHFRLRLPQELKDRVEAIAAAEGRSVTSEVVRALHHWVQIRGAPLYETPPKDSRALHKIADLMKGMLESDPDFQGKTLTFTIRPATDAEMSESEK